MADKKKTATANDVICYYCRETAISLKKLINLAEILPIDRDSEDLIVTGLMDISKTARDLCDIADNV